MATERIVTEFGEEYKCSYFFDADTGASGVDVSRNGNHLGEIIGIRIPDDEDEEETFKAFDNEIINWIVDNEH